MKKILITIDENTIQRIKDLKEMELETTGIKWSTSEMIRAAIYKKWRFETIQGVESNKTGAEPPNPL